MNRDFQGARKAKVFCAPGDQVNAFPMNVCLTAPHENIKDAYAQALQQETTVHLHCSELCLIDFIRR